MNKLFFVFDDIFYLSFLFFQRHPKLFAKSEAIYALIVLECVIIIPLACLIGIFAHHANMPSIRDTFDLRMVVLFIGGCVGYLLYRHYIHNSTITKNHYEQLHLRWENLNQKQKTQRTLCVKGIIIMNTVGILMITILFEHFHII